MDYDWVFKDDNNNIVRYINSNYRLANNILWFKFIITCLFMITIGQRDSRILHLICGIFSAFMVNLITFAGDTI